MTTAEHAEHLRVQADTLLRDRAVGVADHFMKAAFTSVGGGHVNIASYPLVAAHMQASAIAYLAERLAVATATSGAPANTSDA
ncbi:MAG: hypothetical protein HUU13_06825 [Burkholderiaceae bacterium]|nr:hypothetical protein [Burkholderiaceae bacterium]